MWSNPAFSPLFESTIIVFLVVFVEQNLQICKFGKSGVFTTFVIKSGVFNGFCQKVAILTIFENTSFHQFSKYQLWCFWLFLVVQN